MARPSGLRWPVWANQVAGRLPGRAGDARREAGGLWSAGRETGEGRERAERVERKREIKFEFKFKIFSKIPFETWKTLNTKVVGNFKFYIFRFRHQLV